MNKLKAMLAIISSFPELWARLRENCEPCSKIYKMLCTSGTFIMAMITYLIGAWIAWRCVVFGNAVLDKAMHAVGLM